MKWLAKSLLWLFTCAIPVFIAACYGVVYDDEDDVGYTDGNADTETDHKVDAGKDGGQN